MHLVEYLLKLTALSEEMLLLFSYLPEKSGTLRSDYLIFGSQTVHGITYMNPFVFSQRFFFIDNNPDIDNLGGPCPFK